MNQYNFPDAKGHFGPYGGVFVAETLIAALEELKAAYAAAQADPAFRAEYEYELKHFVGRPSPIYHAKRWSEMLGGAQIYLKREDLNHTGAHKVNNCMVWRLQRWLRVTAWNVSSIWAARTSNVRPPTFIA